MLDRNASVFLCSHSQFRGVFIGVAERLKAECGAAIHLYTATSQEAAHYQRTHPDLFASITVANTLYTVCREPVTDEAAVIAAARRNEADLGIGMGALTLTDRHLGRGFALGGFRHPRSQMSRSTSHAQMLNAFNATIDFWRGELERHGPGLILNASKTLCVLARNRGVSVRNLAASRYRNFYYWGRNEFFDTSVFETAFRTATPDNELGLASPYESHLRYRAAFRRQASFWRTLRRSARMLLQWGYWSVRGYEKAKGYFIWDRIGHQWRRRAAVQRMTRRAVPGLDTFASRPFAFFPLATEPETALQRLSPEYMYQLPAIASVARDLPAGAELAVKEHYAAAGRRPRDFYEQIEEFKNVRFMNMSELGLEAARASRAVVTISGTSGFEGAAMGKPVISFGRHNIYNFLPHVMVVTDESELKGYLDRVFAEDFDGAQAAADGKRFLQAIVDGSFDLGEFQPIVPDKISAVEIEAAYRGLLDDLQADVRPIAVVAG